MQGIQGAASTSQASRNLSEAQLSKLDEYGERLFSFLGYPVRAIDFVEIAHAGFTYFNDNGHNAECHRCSVRFPMTPGTESEAVASHYRNSRHGQDCPLIRTIIRTRDINVTTIAEASRTTTSAEAGEASVSTASGATPAIQTEAAVATPAGATPAGATTSTNTNTTEPLDRQRLQRRLQALRAENRRLTARKMCRQCRQVPADLTFLPCGHFTHCQSCGGTHTECPTCRKPVLADVHTFLS